MFLLDSLHEDLNRVPYPPPSVPTREYCYEKDNEMELELLASISWSDYLERSKSIIVDLMQG
jgi:ubiquitin C-terminal hydrolase